MMSQVITNLKLLKSMERHMARRIFMILVYHASFGKFTDAMLAMAERKGG